MPNISTQPQPTSDQQPFNWKKVLVVVVIGAVLIGLGVIIFLLLQPKPEQPTPTTKKATPSAKVSTPSAKKDETAGWKTLSHDSFGIELKYPADWTLKQTPVDIKIESPNLGYSGSTVIKGTYLIFSSPKEYTNHSKPLIDYVQEKLDSYRLAWGQPEPKKETLKSVSLFDYEAVRHNTSYGPDEQGGFVQTTYPILYKSKLYIIARIYPESQGSQKDETFQKILSTIKFLD